MLTIYHLRKSQSERILFLCEELGIPYTLRAYDRDPITSLAPAIFAELHPVGTAPVVVDETADGKRILLGESAAIVEYIISVHGQGRLARRPGDDDYAEYLEAFHFANGSLQAHVSRNNLLSKVPGEAAQGSGPVGFARSRLQRVLKLVDERLGKSTYLVGEELTAADIMTVFSLTTMRGFLELDLTPYDNILRYLKTIGARPAYREAMEKGDPGLEPMSGAKVELFKFGRK